MNRKKIMEQISHLATKMSDREKRELIKWVLYRIPDADLFETARMLGIDLIAELEPTVLQYHGYQP